MPFVRHLGKTNMLTHIPQDIKLELADGFLTLKAGSKVYIPNGVGVFDEYIVQSDISITDTIPRTMVLFINNSGADLFYNIADMYSGATQPSVGQFAVWYDTANNIVKATADGGISWFDGWSLPICIMTSASTSGFTSIDQVFNGFGYIGSTVFALPGVKGLIPNGINADGSLKNIELTISSVTTTTIDSYWQRQTFFVYENGRIMWYPLEAGEIWYDEDRNIWIDTRQPHGYSLITPLAQTTASSGKITSFTPKKIGEGYIKNKLYQLARRKRTYYKYGTEPNVSVIGSPTINEGVVSGFSNSNYLTFLSFRPGTKIWEQHWEITTASNVTTAQYFAGEGAVDYSKPAVGVQSGRWIVFISSTGTGWNIASGVTGGTVNANTTYYLKYGWNGSEYYLESSTDDNEFTRVITINNSNAIVDNSLDSVIGNSHFVGAWLGSVNLNNSYIKINSEMWWHGTKAVESNESNYDYYTDNLVSYTPVVQDEFTYRITHKQTATGTYTITLDRDWDGDLLFVGNGGGGGSSQNDSYWRNTSGGSGACFQGRVRLPRGTYTLTIGTLGYGYNIGNTADMTGGVDSTDSYLTDENGNELIRVGCGVRGTVIGTGGAGGTLTLGTLEVLETTKAVNGNQGDAWGPVYGQGKQVFAVSAYDGTTTGYGAGTSSYYGGGNVYGVAGIFKLDIEYLDKGLRSY